MATPAEITVGNLSGTWQLNKDKSDNTSDLLKMQNVGFIIRQIASRGSHTVELKQYTDDQGVEHIDQTMTTAGNANEEPRVLDWQDHERENKIWGKVASKCRRAKISESTIDEWAKAGWDADEVVETVAQSLQEDWDAHQLWGFQVVDGQRKHVRKIVAKKPGWKDQKLTTVYDWVKA